MFTHYRYRCFCHFNMLNNKISYAGPFYEFPMKFNYRIICYTFYELICGRGCLDNYKVSP